MKIWIVVLAVGFSIATMVSGAQLGKARKRGDLTLGEYAALTCLMWGWLLAAMTAFVFAAWNGPLDQVPAVVPVLAGGAILMFAVVAGIRAVTRLRHRQH